MLKELNSATLMSMIKSKDTSSLDYALEILRNNKDSFSKKEFESLYYKIPVVKRIRDFSDVLWEAGLKEEEVVSFLNPKTKKQRFHNACDRIQLITEVYNEGTRLDWSKTDQYKYFPYFIKQGSGWAVRSASDGDDFAWVGFGFYFKTRELAEDAGKKFLDIYIDYLP